MKLQQTAYDHDPRIQAEIAKENAAKAAAKQAKKEEKEKKWKEINEKKAAEELKIK